MTSELRPAVETRAKVLDQLLSELQDGNAWDSTISLLADYADLVQDLLKDREAVRAEQAAYLAKARKEAGQNHDLHMAAVNEVVDLKAELAKFKALAETLAGAVEEAAYSVGMSSYDRHKVADKALLQYKEARDA